MSPKSIVVTIDSADTEAQDAALYARIERQRQSQSVGKMRQDAAQTVCDP